MAHVRDTGMNGTTYLIAVIGVMTAATFFTRVLPFALLRNMADHPLLLFLGRYTPPAIMTILVLYSLRGIDLTAAPFGAPELTASLITVTLHLWLRNTLLSIFSGTAFYMFVVQTGVFI